MLRTFLITTALTWLTASSAGALGVGVAAPVHFSPADGIVGTSIDVFGTGEPGHVYVIAASTNPGPSAFLPGLDLDMGLDFVILGSGFVDGSGDTGTHPVQVPMSLLGQTGHSQMLTLALAPISDVQKSPGVATNFVAPEPCTPAVEAACFAAGLEPCQLGSADCGRPLCNPAVTAACVAAGECGCDPATGDCYGSEGEIGCGSGTVCGGVGTCVCNECDCPAPHFGAQCSCTELSVQYNGLYQHSFIDNIPETLMSTTNAMSFEVWIKPTKVGVALATRLGGGVAWGFSLGVSGSTTQANTLRLWNGDGGAADIMVGPTIIPLDEWVHVAFTWDGSAHPSARTGTAVMYINGVFEHTGTYRQRPANPGQLLIGLFGTNYYGGQMDDLRLWSTVRTPAEILDNYDKSLVDTNVPGLIFNHNMQKWVPGIAGRCVDSSPNGFHLMHSLADVQGYETQAINIAPGPPTVSTDICPSNCNGVGACACGICTCFNPADLTYDCSDTTDPL